METYTDLGVEEKSSAWVDEREQQPKQKHLMCGYNGYAQLNMI